MSDFTDDDAVTVVIPAYNAEATLDETLQRPLADAPGA